jgi:hypothetical protein
MVTYRVGAIAAKARPELFVDSLPHISLGAVLAQRVLRWP